MGDANPKFGNQKPRKLTHFEIAFEYAKFVVVLIGLAIFLVLSFYAIYQMVTNPSRYQEMVRTIVDSTQRNIILQRLLQNMPPKVTPVVTWVTGVSFTLVSTINSALVIAFAIFGLAGFFIGYVIWKRPIRRSYVPPVNRKKPVPKS